MAFVKTVSRADAEGPVREIYQEIEKRVGFLPNWAEAFSLRPEVWRAWDGLLNSIRANLSVRTYELATLGAARSLRSSYCALAHGRVLAEKVFDAPAVTAIMQNNGGPLEPGERAMMAFVDKVVTSADRITAADVDQLHAHGFTDVQIFDVAAAAAARCFFSKLLDAMGVQPDARFNEVMAPALREALTVGRPVASSVAP